MLIIFVSSDQHLSAYLMLLLLLFVHYRYVKGPDQWFERFGELKKFMAMNGNCDVPSRYGPNKRLGRWVSFQRTQFRLRNEGRHSHLTDDRMELLNNLGFRWIGSKKERTKLGTELEVVTEVKKNATPVDLGMKFTTNEDQSTLPSFGVLNNKVKPVAEEISNIGSITGGFSIV